MSWTARAERRERSPEALCRLWRTAKGLGVSVPGLPGLFPSETGLFWPHVLQTEMEKSQGGSLEAICLALFSFLPNLRHNVEQLAWFSQSVLWDFMACWIRKDLEGKGREREEGR